MSRIRGSIVAVAGVAAISGASAQTYSVLGEVSNTISGETNITTSNPGTASITDGSSVAGFSIPGALGVSATALQNWDVATIQANRTVNDWTISGPSGGMTNSVINLSLTGTLNADTWYGMADVQLHIGISNTTTGQQVFSDGVGFEVAGDGNGFGNYSYIWDVNGLGTGGFSNFVSQADLSPSTYTTQLQTGLAFSTNSITWDAGDTYQMSVAFSATAQFVDPYTSSAPEDSAQFYDPFSFGPSEVLDLPTGWNLNSPESAIVNDAVTPEPAPFAALALGCAGLLLRRRRR